MSHTAQPPRRELYLLQSQLPPCEKPESTESSLTADKGGFLLPKSKPPRIGGENWREQRSHAFGIYNGNYSPSGVRLGDFPNPWNAIGPDSDALFTTHSEALQWVLQEARK